MSRVFATQGVCSICGMDYLGIGNNAQPINEGRCCDWCDMLVTARRINDMKREMKRNAVYKVLHGTEGEK